MIQDDSVLKYCLAQVSCPNDLDLNSCLPHNLELDFERLHFPGATATPLHMAELNRERDDSRYDTEKLQKISIAGLTCAQVEEYLAEAIKEGESDDDNDNDDPAITPCWKTLPTNTPYWKNQHGKEETNPGETLTETNSLDKHDSILSTSKGASTADKFWRCAAVFGVSVGAGCLFIMSRASKAKAR